MQRYQTNDVKYIYLKMPVLTVDNIVRVTEKYVVYQRRWCDAGNTGQHLRS